MELTKNKNYELKQSIIKRTINNVKKSIVKSKIR